MRTRNSYFPNNTSVTIPRLRNKRRAQNIVVPELRTIVEVAPMVDSRTMEELLQAPTEGYGEAIVIPKINADHFEINTNFLQFVQANPYHGFERENPHTHINNFKRITLTLKFRDAPNDVIKLMMFPYSLEGAARVWYDKEPCNTILTWKDLVNKFVNQFFPPSKTTHLKNEISRFTQRFEETFGEAWERFKEMLRACPHNGFMELTQIDTFYNGLNENDQDSLNAAAGGNLLSKTTREALHIIENRSNVCYSRNEPNISRMNTTSRKNASKTDDRIDELANQILTLVEIVSKKVVTPVTVKATLPKANIPYPSRLNDQKLREKATNQIEKFFQIFQDLHFDIIFADALLLMPKFASTIKSLLANKDKLFELAKIKLNENCSAMLLKKLPEKLGDPGKFLIPCDFPGMDVCHALSDLGVSINRMPLSIWKNLSLPELTPTWMTLKLGDRSITRPKGVLVDVFVKVGKFHFPTDFVVVDFEADPRVPLILGRSFLRTGRALIDVYEEEITLRVIDEAVTFNLNQTTRYSSTYDDMSVNLIDVIDIDREEYAQEMLGFSKNSPGGNPTSTSEPIISDSSPSFTPFEGSDFILEEIEAYLKDESILPKIDHGDCDPERDICLIENLLNDDPFQLPSMDLKQGEVVKAKSSIEEPSKLELKDLPSHLEYAYLEGIDPRFYTHEILMKEDYKPAVQSQRRVNPRIHEAIKKEVIKLLDTRMIYLISDSLLVEKTIEVFMDDFLVFGDSFSSCLSHLDTMLQQCEDTNLVLNWEKCYFMVKEGIVLGHKISKNRLEVDRAKVDVIAKLPHLTIVKGVRSFLGHVGFYLRFIQDFSKIARPMTHLLKKETSFVFSKYCIDAFETLKKNLTEALVLVVPDWNLPFELMCDISDFTIGAVLEKRKMKHFQPIHYASKTMTEAQTHYTTTEKEMHAVVYAFEKFWPYLVLSKSIVYTDHSALKYLLSKQDAKPRLLRYVLDYCFCYI
uniref:Reverse transcriptase domain-containing protein n=1 Tax=Tanacetum cinerariifolium TaxID=118510 RepID=A0A6L2NV62_TANCI|nr:reverse transcriptase domain-containing protein [Tanacetum cinerariifolium]